MNPGILARAYGLGVALSASTMTAGWVLANDTWIHAGIGILLAIPATRIALQAMSYLDRRQWRFAACSLTVLGALAFAYWSGRTH